MLYLSKIIKVCNNAFLYDAVSNKLLELPANVEHCIRSGNKKAEYHDFLTANKLRDIMEPIEFEHEYLFTKDELSWLINNRMESLTLTLTEQCNFRCSYCVYMPKYLSNTYELKSMTKDIAFKAIDIFMQASKQIAEPFIGFYGGEPLLMFNLIKECVDCCKENYPFASIFFDVTTNGLLLEKE